LKPKNHKNAFQFNPQLVRCRLATSAFPHLSFLRFRSPEPSTRGCKAPAPVSNSISFEPHQFAFPFIPLCSCLEAAWFEGNTIPQTMGTFVPFHCVPQLQPQGLKAIVALCILQGWEIRRLAKAAAIHDTDGQSPHQSFRATSSSCRYPKQSVFTNPKPLDATRPPATAPNARGVDAGDRSKSWSSQPSPVFVVARSGLDGARATC
jgi:hypothetical protein